MWRVEGHSQCGQSLAHVGKGLNIYDVVILSGYSECATLGRMLYSPLDGGKCI